MDRLFGARKLRVALDELPAVKVWDLRTAGLIARGTRSVMIEASGSILTVTVEDETGPRVSNDAATEQKIDLGTFYHQFIRSGRGTATVSAEVQDPEGERHLNELLDAILVNRHPVTATVRHS